MKPLYTLVLSSLLALWPGMAPAQTETAQTEAPAIPAVGPFSASDIVLADLMFVRRPIVVFADSPLDPTFIRQMGLLLRDLPSLDDRDVVVITDTDPAAKSELRQSLPPRGALYSNSMMISSTFRLAPALAFTALTTPLRSAFRMFSIFIASTVASA